MIKWDLPDIGEDEIFEVTKSISSGWVGSNGECVKQFEKALAEKIKVRYVIVVNNGTSALLCALLAMKEHYLENRTLPFIGVPTFTFIATANTARLIGSIRLIDCSRETWNITNEQLPDGINLLLTVDVGGLPVDYSSFDLPVISDSAESMGAEYHGELVGGQCDIHTFSFQRAKIITTGEGGAVTTNNPHLYEIMRSICNHGYSPQKEEWQYRHNRFGLNFRMTELEAAVGLAQFKKLDKYVKERRAKAKIYKDIVGDLARYQQEPADRRSSHFFFGILVSHDTNQFCMEMLKRGIQTKTWTPVHQQTPYSRMCGNWKNANWVSQRIVLLPIHNKLSQDETIFVAETAKNILKGKQ